MNRPLLLALLVSLGLPIVSAVEAAGFPCPDRSPATMAALSTPGCNVWIGDLLATLANGVRLDPDGIAVVDSETVLSPGPVLASDRAGGGFLAPVALAERRCYASGGTPGAAGGAGRDDHVVRRTLSLGDLVVSDCRPVAGSWPIGINHYPRLIAPLTLVALQFGAIAVEMHQLDVEQRRLVGIFGPRPVTDRVEGEALRPIDRSRELSRLALDLAAATRHFLTVAETMVAPRRGGNRSADARSADTWSRAVEALFPSPAELAESSLEERVMVLASVLAAVRPSR